MTANARDPQGAASHEPQCGGQHNPGDRHIVRYLCGACGYTEDTEYIRAAPPSEHDFWRAHVPVTGTQHDPANGLIHGYCERCRVPWPCQWSPELTAAPPSGPEARAPVWLVERTIDGRAHWLRWRDLEQREWVTDANLADHFDWRMAAIREARLLSQFAGIDCTATEHIFLDRAAAPPSGLTPPSGGATAPDPGEVIQAMRDATAALVCIGAHAQAGPHTLGCRCGCAVCERRDDAHRLAVRWLLARLDAHRA